MWHDQNRINSNGSETNKVYDPATGRISEIHDSLAANDISFFGYQFDAIGNLEFRANHKNNRLELFQYDSLYRLQQSKLVSFTSDQSGSMDSFNYNANAPLHEINLTYDALGNITSKSDIGAYSYGMTSGRNCSNNHAGPHAVTRITGSKNTDYCYDNNGNMLSGDGRTIDYTSFNKPDMIEQIRGGATNRVTFNYGPERSRIKRVDQHNGKTTTTFYLGNLEIVNNDGFREWKYTIGDYAQKIFKAADQSTRVNYFHRDHLGSLIAITDEIGTILEKFSFDAWGKRRYLNWQSEVSLFNFKPAIGWETHRGFTNHEHLDSVGLIHMNGRVYDPAIGRFLSADPFIQAPTNTQSFNRYSYVINNPLSYTDPSGYLFKWLERQTKRLARSVKKQVKSVLHSPRQALKNLYQSQLKSRRNLFQKKWFRQVAAIATFACGPFQPLCAAGVSSASADAYGASPGDSLKAGARAGAAAYIAQAAGGVYRTGGNAGNAFGGNIFERAIIRGAAYGVGSEITGGYFNDGFKIGVGSQFLQAGIEAFTTRSGAKNNDMTWDSGESYTEFKPNGLDYVDGRKSNIGIGCRFLGGCMVNGKLPWDHEGSRFMMTVNKVPGMNSMSVFHDVLVGKWERARIALPLIGDMSLPKGTWFTMGSIPPSIPLTYAALGGYHHQRTVKDSSTKLNH